MKIVIYDTRNWPGPTNRLPESVSWVSIPQCNARTWTPSFTENCFACENKLKDDHYLQLNDENYFVFDAFVSTQVQRGAHTLVIKIVKYP